MNFFIFLFFIFCTIDLVLSIEEAFECVKRKSGACRAINVSEDFDHFIDLNELRHGDRLSTIVEIDYFENKYSYELQHTERKSIVDIPVVEILFFKSKDATFNYRLVLGEKLGRLAYLEIVDGNHSINYNNYSPKLPSWPFSIYVTLDSGQSNRGSKLAVHTRNGDGFDKLEPFLIASSNRIDVQYMSVRNRNKSIKLVGFYDCSTKYGASCGTEKTETITDCRERFSPLGSGLFNHFVDMSKFNRLEGHDYGYNEIFGIYRRNNDSCVIFFSSEPDESGTYIRITIGEEITVRVRSSYKDSGDYFEKDAVKKSWNQEPSAPNFIRVNISSVLKQISIYNLHDEEPILTMKLCNYFNSNDTIRYMSVTSNRFKTVDFYYDCCFPDQMEDCHVYEKKDISTQTDSVEKAGNTTMLSEEDSSTMSSEDGFRTTLLVEVSTTIRSEEEHIAFNDVDDKMQTECEEIATDASATNKNVVEELKRLKGCQKTNTFLDTSRFGKTGSTQYTYAIHGTHLKDYCPSEIDANSFDSQPITDEPKVDD